MMRMLLLLVITGLLTRAQDLSYTLMPADGDTPTPRFDGTIAYDAESRRIFLFGGDDGQPRNDLYSYSLASRRWERRSPSGATPPPRFGHTAIFEPVSRRLIIFGGQAGGFFSDVWAYDPAANAWAQLAPDQAGPSRRYGHSAIYDAQRRRMIISHGFTDAGRFDDTWAFDLVANRWSDISPASGRPLRRCLHHAVYDAANQQMLLFGGCASGFGPCPLGDLWSFDLNTGRWREVSGAGPAPRSHFGFAFDSANQRAILFSGTGAPNDTWAFDARAARWQQLATPNSPAARSRHQAAYISDRRATAFFGGNTETGRTNELWLLDPVFTAATPKLTSAGIVDAFSGLAGGVAPGELISIYGSDLGPAEGVAFAFDPVTGTLPVSGAGLEVRFNGLSAPLFYAGAGQVNVQAPFEIADAAMAQITVRLNGQLSDPVSVPVLATRPNLFPAAWNEDGSLNSKDRPVSPGSIVVLYATGQGVTTPASPTGARPANGIFPIPAAPLTLTVNGLPATVLFHGQAPGTAGVMQINARLAPGASGEVKVQLQVGNAQSPPLSIFVR